MLAASITAQGAKGPTVEECQLPLAPWHCSPLGTPGTLLPLVLWHPITVRVPREVRLSLKTHPHCCGIALRLHRRCCRWLLVADQTGVNRNRAPTWSNHLTHRRMGEDCCAQVRAATMGRRGLHLVGQIAVSRAGWNHASRATEPETASRRMVRRDRDCCARAARRMTARGSTYRSHRAVPGAVRSAAVPPAVALAERTDSIASHRRARACRGTPAAAGHSSVRTSAGSDGRLGRWGFRAFERLECSVVLLDARPRIAHPAPRLWVHCRHAVAPRRFAALESSWSPAVRARVLGIRVRSAVRHSTVDCETQPLSRVGRQASSLFHRCAVSCGRQPFRCDRVRQRLVRVFQPLESARSIAAPRTRGSPVRRRARRMHCACARRCA